jgi:hypothetical protein
MKTPFAFALAITLLVCAVIVDAQIPNPGLEVQGRSGSHGAATDYAPTPEYGMEVWDSRPHFAVRFDDGRAEQYEYVKDYFLPRGIPVSLCINSDNIGSANKMTWDEIRDLIRLGELYDAPVSIVQHTNDIFARVANYGTASYDPFDETVSNAYLDSMLSPLTIIAETNVRPRFVVAPGNPGRTKWIRRHLGKWESKLREWGYWWGTYDGTTAEADMGMFFPSASLTATGRDATSNDSAARTYIKPGVLASPYSFSNETLDLGTSFIEYVSYDSLVAKVDRGLMDVSRGNHLPTQGYRSADNRANGWLLGNKTLHAFRDYNGATEDVVGISELGVTGLLGTPGFTYAHSANDSVGIVARSWTQMDFRYKLYNVFLPWNTGGWLALHSETASDTANDGAIDDTGDDLGFDIADSVLYATDTDMISIIDADDVVGHINFDWIAYVLAELAKQDFIVLTTAEGMAKWAMGQWAEGVDLIGNPSGIQPQYAIGDTLGPIAEYPYPQGWGGYGSRYAAYTNSSAAVGNWNPYSVINPVGIAVDTEAALEYSRGAGASVLYNRIWPSSPSAYSDGSGGILLEGNTSNSDAAIDQALNDLWLSQGGLMPGMYNLQFAWKDFNTSYITLADIYANAMFRQLDITEMYGSTAGTEANFSYATVDTVISVAGTSVDVSPMRTDDTLFPRGDDVYEGNFPFRIPDNFASPGTLGYSFPVGRPTGAVMLHFYAGAAGDSSVVSNVRLIYQKKH